MNILITAPSLETKKNVSGISTVVNTIIDNNLAHTYYHYLLGRPDKVNSVTYVFIFFKQLLLFPLKLKKEKIDIVHQNLPFDPKGLMRESVINFWCYLLNVPVVLHIHGGEFLMKESPKKIWKYLSSLLFRRSKKVVVLSELEKTALLELHNFKGAVVLSNSIDVDQYRFEERTFLKGKPTFLFLGRFHDSKGLHDIHDAFVKLRNAGVKFRFILCGSGPLEEFCKDNFSSLLGQDFDFRGIVSGDLKIKAFRDADFFLLPSRYGEGLPMALLEAMASGLIPIVTDDASMKYVVQDFVNGIQVNKYDSLDISNQIQKVFESAHVMTGLSNMAVSTVAREYHIKPYLLKLNKIYLEVNK